jgi:hypothetical protein
MEGESRSKEEEKKKRREYRAVVAPTDPHFLKPSWLGIHLVSDAYHTEKTDD